MKKLNFSKNTRFDCGIFDSNTYYPNQKQSSERNVVYFEIEFFISCNGTSFLDNEAHKLIPQTILLAKPGQTRHSTFSFKCYYIHYWLTPESKYYKMLMDCPNYYYIIDPKLYLSIWEEIINYVNIKQYDVDSDIVGAKLTELFYHLKEDAAKNNNYLTVQQSYNSAIPESVKYIEEHYNENLSLQVLAKQASYSKNYYQNIFKSVMGCSPREYIQRIRIQHAKQLLNDPLMPLIEIAYNCGFSSQAYFNYIFKKETNITPLEYRSMLISNYMQDHAERISSKK